MDILDDMEVSKLSGFFFKVNYSFKCKVSYNKKLIDWASQRMGNVQGIQPRCSIKLSVNIPINFNSRKHILHADILAHGQSILGRTSM